MTRYCGVMSLLCMAALGAGLGGCQSMDFKGRAPEPVASAPEAAAPADSAIPGAAGDWPFAPVAVRIHPFTSFEAVEAAENANAAVALDARLELIDPLGDVTKGVGDWRLELYESGMRASQAGQERRLYVWDVPMTTLEANRRHYDSITRTYAFKLKLDAPPPPGKRLELRVQFDDHTGRRFTAKAPLQYRADK